MAVKMKVENALPKLWDKNDRKAIVKALREHVTPEKEVIEYTDENGKVHKKTKMKTISAIRFMFKHDDDKIYYCTVMANSSPEATQAFADLIEKHGNISEKALQESNTGRFKVGGVSKLYAYVKPYKGQSKKVTAGEIDSALWE